MWVLNFKKNKKTGLNFLNGVWRQTPGTTFVGIVRCAAINGGSCRAAVSATDGLSVLPALQGRQKKNETLSSLPGFYENGFKQAVRKGGRRPCYKVNKRYAQNYTTCRKISGERQTYLRNIPKRSRAWKP